MIFLLNEKLKIREVLPGGARSLSMKYQSHRKQSQELTNGIREDDKIFCTARRLSAEHTGSLQEGRKFFLGILRQAIEI